MMFKEILAPLASSRTLVQVGSLALCIGLYSCLPIIKENSPLGTFGDIPSQIHAAMSLVLGWLLVFRTNSAYARWWEARTLWGSLVNASRNFAIKLSTLADLSREDINYLETRITQFPVLLMLHLRSKPEKVLSTRSDGGSSNPDHRPAQITQEIYQWVSKHHAEGKIDGDRLRILDLELARFMDICGACERIARTPIARSYRIFARQCIVLFLFTLPWGIVADFGWWTIPLATITAYFMIGMEVVAEHVEEPFGYDEDDLDLEGLCETIEKSVRQIFARADV